MASSALRLSLGTLGRAAPDGSACWATRAMTDRWGVGKDIVARLARARAVPVASRRVQAVAGPGLRGQALRPDRPEVPAARQRPGCSAPTPFRWPHLWLRPGVLPTVRDAGGPFSSVFPCSWWARLAAGWHRSCGCWCCAGRCNRCRCTSQSRGRGPSGVSWV